MSRVVFNERGNAVTMEKDRQPSENGHQHGP
jgi:hypothetical protein